MQEAESANQAKATTTLEQYKILVESSIKATEWRASSNKFYLTLSLAVFSLLSLRQQVGDISIATSLIGILLCIFWAMSIRSFKILNTVKFKLIHELEAKLDEQIFAREWNLLQTGGYARLTSIEGISPFLFAIAHLFLILTATR